LVKTQANQGGQMIDIIITIISMIVFWLLMIGCAMAALALAAYLLERKNDRN